MSNSGSEHAQVKKHYDVVAANYAEQYDQRELYNVEKKYPANYFRLQMLLNSFVKKKIKRAIEIGVGEGTPLSTLEKAGISMWGMDISERMVEKSKEKMRSIGCDPSRIFWGDIQDSLTYASLFREEPFDALIAMGVMPHVDKDELVIKNMAALVKTGGSVFVEFRNKLFSLFTFNRNTMEFLLNDLLKSVSSELKEGIRNELERRLFMELPKERKRTENGDGPGYDAILSKFHNPFEMVEVFKTNGFVDVKLQWYHYHAAMPFVSEISPELFRRESIKLEHETSDWRGMFLCSAFVIEAVKGDKE